MEAKNLQGKKLFILIGCIVLCLQLLTVGLNFRHMGRSELILIMVIIALLSLIMFAAYKGNKRAKIFFGLILLTSGVNNFNHWGSFESMTFMQWYYLVIGSLLGLMGLVVISSPSIEAFVKNRKIN